MLRSISVIIPCYKEQGVIATTLLGGHEFVQSRFTEHEIITITDGSPDGTLEEVERFQSKHPDLPLINIAFPENRGKGAASGLACSPPAMSSLS